MEEEGEEKMKKITKVEQCCPHHLLAGSGLGGKEEKQLKSDKAEAEAEAGFGIEAADHDGGLIFERMELDYAQTFKVDYYRAAIRCRPYNKAENVIDGYVRTSRFLLIPENMGPES